MTLPRTISKYANEIRLQASSFTVLAERLLMVIKVCFSSRPWNVFERVYGDNSGQKLELQSLTQGDIIRFVREKLWSDPRFREMKSRDTRYDDLVMGIATKAQGVFLWVFLVVRSLGRGLTNEDTILELQERVRFLPNDLEGYIQRMLDSVEDVYHKQAARLYLIRLNTPGILRTMTVSYFDSNNLMFALDSPMEPWSSIEIRERCNRTRFRVMARCTDLLELSPLMNLDSDLPDSRVDFLHRTVHDFLETSNMHHLLTERAGRIFDTHEYMCNATLAQIKRLALSYKAHNRRFDELIETFMHHLTQAELRNGTHLIPVVDELDRTMTVFRKTHPATYSPRSCNPPLLIPKNVTARHPKTWLITEAIKRQLFQYVSSNPDKLRMLIEEGCPDGLSPLYVALGERIEDKVDPRIIEILLEQGAKPNMTIGTVGQNTVWQSYLGSVRFKAVGAERRAHISIIETLLMHGADPNTDKGDDDFHTTISKFGTFEEIAHLEAIRLQKRAETKPLYHLKKWLPWTKSY